MINVFRPQLALPLVVLLCVITTGCDDDDERETRVPWNPNESTIISEGGTYGTYGTPGEGGCVIAPDTTEEVCVAGTHECADETTADIVVDDQGNVLDVVCIPPNVSAVESIDLEDGEIDQTSNSTALIFTEGGVHEGDLAVDGNNVVLYGEGPDVAQIDGTLHITGNNAIVRGIEITGDLIIDKNSAIVVFCRVLGDVYMAKNNTTLSGCDIHGSIYVMDNNTKLFGNRVGGEDLIDDQGKGTTCEGNVSFDAQNADVAGGNDIDC